jgi:hypothetical protein
LVDETLFYNGSQASQTSPSCVDRRKSNTCGRVEYPTAEEAFKAARDVLKLLEPLTSNDTETLGLWGSMHKRLWELTKESSYLDEVARAYECGFYLRNDHYNGINNAYLLNERSWRCLR